MQVLTTAPPLAPLPSPLPSPFQRLEELHANQQTDGRLSARYPAGSPLA
jgi:hypothetical protein